MLYSLILTFQKFLNEPHNSELTFDMNDLLLETFRLCNFFDTVQGIIFLNSIIILLDTFFDTTYNKNTTMKAIRWSLRGLEVSTYLNDITDLS